MSKSDIDYSAIAAAMVRSEYKSTLWLYAKLMTEVHSLNIFKENQVWFTGLNDKLFRLAHSVYDFETPVIIEDINGKVGEKGVFFDYRSAAALCRSALENYLVQSFLFYDYCDSVTAQCRLLFWKSNGFAKLVNIWSNAELFSSRYGGSPEDISKKIEEYRVEKDKLTIELKQISNNSCEYFKNNGELKSWDRYFKIREYISRTPINPHLFNMNYSVYSEYLHATFNSVVMTIELQTNIDEEERLVGGMLNTIAGLVALSIMQLHRISGVRIEFPTREVERYVEYWLEWITDSRESLHYKTSPLFTTPPADPDPR